MRSRQLPLALVDRPRWGGSRRGAGRRRSPGRRPSVPHRARPGLDARHPVLVTLRARAGVGWLRSRGAYPALETALAAASSDAFRVAHFSVQTDHVHLIVEAVGREALTRGMRGLAIRCALAVNRALGRSGALWGERYHASALRTPRMVRNALVYVLANARKHLRVRAGLDPCSSGSCRAASLLQNSHVFFLHPHDLRNGPRVTSDPRLHRGRDAQGRVDAGEAART